MTTSSKVQWLEPVVSALTLGLVSASTPAPAPLIPTVSTGIGVTTIKPRGEPAPDVPKMRLGMNLLGVDYYGTGRAFMNLVAGSRWALKGKGTMPADRLDKDGNVIRLADGETASTNFAKPTKVYRGVSVDVICRWDGKAKPSILGGEVRNVKVSAQSLTFTWLPGYNDLPIFQFTKLDESNPLRKLDCREADADPKAIFDPTFLAEVKKFDTLRFVKWMPAAEANTPVTWAKRTTATSAFMRGPDSVPVEYMVMLANMSKANPWFNMPWNADDDYIRHFAEYVRDNLDRSLVVHVETSNEVWNYMYKVTKQAETEGLAAGFSTNPNQAMLRRYSERAGQVMDIWTDVFKGQMHRLVRVAATQNGTFSATTVLSFRDTAKKVDALAIAPYFGGNLKPGRVAQLGLENFFSVNVNQMMENAYTSAAAVKKIAKQYNLRFVTYEGGQHMISGEDLVQQRTVQRDPRMGQAYTKYLSRWQSEFGDLMILFAEAGTIDKYGAWGVREYLGQPLNEAPKAQAVELFRQSYMGQK